MTEESSSSGGATGARPDLATPVTGDPLVPAPDPGVSGDAAEVTPPAGDRPFVPPVAPVPPERDEADDSGSKAKAAAVVAGAVAVANKVRKEAPKVVHQVRERRVAGRCVIVTEVDGRFLAIGPYKDEESARQDAFKVGGTPHVAELRSDTAFFAPTDQP